MSRSTRLEPVRKVVDDDERLHAERWAVSKQRLTECECKLQELEQYRSDYRKNLDSISSKGTSVSILRDYQVFLARLTDAIKQQTQVVATARCACEFEMQAWQKSARRCKAIDHVVENWRTEERRESDRREQRDSDERAQRATYGENFSSLTRKSV
jgi:flagellar protein FliJ